MRKTKRTVMALALGLLLVLFSTAFTALPVQASMSRTASASTTTQPHQFGWSGWSEVPGNGFTMSGPATSSYLGNDYAFVRGTNNHIYMNSYNGTTWSGWSQVPGNQFTLSGPTAATYVAGDADLLALLVRGTNDHLYMNTFDGTTWRGWSEVAGNGLTPSAPAATRFVTGLGPVLYLFVRGTDNKIYLNILSGGISWSGWSQVPGNGSTPDAPGATSFFNKVYLFVRGTNDRIYENLLQIPA